MSDIVERLRRFGAVIQGRDPKDYAVPIPAVLIVQTADEIERLHSEVAWHEEENHRLRAALHKIAEWDLTGTAIAALGGK